MADHLSPEGRSRNMAGIRSKNTKPELALRNALRSAGATGYRLHRKDLPGRPDMAFMRWKVAVFVDGVFWHGHPDHWNPDKASSDYWRLKIARNIERDRAAEAALLATGWTVVRVWDQEVKADLAGCLRRVLDALSISGWRGHSDG
jgi:DNA mismatch endonuclease, patch repair protein